MPVEWGELLPVPHQMPWTKETIRELQTRPGEWALVRRVPTRGSASTTVQRLKQLGCEATQRQQDDDKVAIWARWPIEAVVS